MKRETTLLPLTDQDVTARFLLPDPSSSSGFLYALLLTATLLLSVLAVIFFR